MTTPAPSKDPPRSRRTRTDIAVDHEYSEYLRFLVRSYDQLCPGKREQLFIAVAARNPEPLIEALRTRSSTEVHLLMSMLEELLGHESVEPQAERQRRLKVRAWVRKTRRKARNPRQSRERKRNYDERMRTFVKKLRYRISAERAKLSSAIRRDRHRYKEALQQIVEKILAPYLTNTQDYRCTAALKVKRKIDQDLRKLNV